jgi:GMP synthase (glutamine-hydrolysing)
MSPDIDTAITRLPREPDSLRILLIQAREPDDTALDEEFRSFVERSGCLSPDHFERLNVLREPPRPAHLDDIDVLFVGGSGRFSVSKANFDGYRPFLELMKTVVERGMPMLASCFGFHALVESLGGRLVREPEYAEIGTEDIHLNERGRRDPLLGQLPSTFPAQLGHNDSVVELPDSLVPLARSDACPIQAVRMPGQPIVATQFHPELTDRDNMKRYVRYLENYEDPNEVSREESLERAEQIHRPSPDSNRLVELFLEHVTEGRFET